MSHTTTTLRTMVPVLTEVLEVSQDDEPPAAPPMLDAVVMLPADPPAAVEAAAPRIDEEALVIAVLDDVQRQVDLMIEHHVVRALEPALQALTAELVTSARKALADGLRDVVRQAVKQETERVRKLR